MRQEEGQTVGFAKEDYPEAEQTSKTDSEGRTPLRVGKEASGKDRNPQEAGRTPLEAGDVAVSAASFECRQPHRQAGR